MSKQEKRKKRKLSKEEKRKMENMKFFLRVVADIEINRTEEEKEAVRNYLRKFGYRPLDD